MFLFSKSKFLIPVNSILIKCKPIKPKINGKMKLNVLGKKEVIFILKNAYKKTSIIPTVIKNNPV